MTHVSIVKDLSSNNERAGCAGNIILELDPLKYTARPSTSVCSFCNRLLNVEVVDKDPLFTGVPAVSLNLYQIFGFKDDI